MTDAEARERLHELAMGVLRYDASLNERDIEAIAARRTEMTEKAREALAQACV